MEVKHEEILNEIKSGKPYKFILNDESSIEFEKKGLNRYKMILRDSSGTKKKKVYLKESGLIKLIEKFAQKATHMNKIVH